MNYYKTDSYRFLTSNEDFFNSKQNNYSGISFQCQEAISRYTLLEALKLEKGLLENKFIKLSERLKKEQEEFEIWLSRNSFYTKNIER